ncbi:4Fe-4S dicluster domain-containing protein [Dissulfurirhabdus thermomarina]|uniref:4Fe-4S dicluster domain-containing protein n=1 Tax=Dissulfurirhabdus thermomarina TaxID=1765737 RepID=A0A6N9TK84_DISTH|nr:4Fe-4S dicluster domain-containing protein [Dissulfurirhabdus thermomarina]NDY41499.1 4Fe-4S dicluster domain-containing protein [Dissulfurirhabdus thermomarina]NMX23874.1 4Fe-4S binding protein [Dissulfurirhabdus thermomarina]
MEWENDARETLRRVPFFVRGRVRRRVEDAARAAGARRVTLAHLEACRRRFLADMSDEVRGFQVETCFGPAGCPNRAVAFEGFADELERRLEARDLKGFLRATVRGPLKMHHEFRVAVSDCPNACSRPQIVDAGFIGAVRPRVTGEPCIGCGACEAACREAAVRPGGEKEAPAVDPDRCLACGACIRACPTGALAAGESGFRVLVGGRLGRHPRLAEELPGIHPPEAAAALLDRALDLFTGDNRGGERFADILERTGLRPLLPAAEPDLTSNPNA